MRLLLALTALLALAGEVRAEDNALWGELTAACFECHGPGGVSQLATRPTIAGQKARYLKRQLLLFRQAHEEGRLLVSGMPARGDMLMSHVSAALAEPEIEVIATYLESLPCDGGEAKKSAPVEMPPEAQSCAVCHGRKGISGNSDIPNLAGQNQGYIKRQLILFRESALSITADGAPTWRVHPVMKGNARALSLAEIDILSVYYSSLACR